MLEREKKPRIDYVTLLFKVPVPSLGELQKTIASLGGKGIKVPAKTCILHEDRWITSKQLDGWYRKSVFAEGQIKDLVDKFCRSLEPITSRKLPAKEVESLVKLIAALCSSAGNKESVPWEEVYPNYDATVALRGARKREGLTQKQLAQLIGISQTHISEMEHGKRTIGKEMAKRLANSLKVDYRVFL